MGVEIFPKARHLSRNYLPLRIANIGVRKVHVCGKANQSIWQSGSRPELFDNIVEFAIMVLELLTI